MNLPYDFPQQDKDHREAVREAARERSDRFCPIEIDLPRPDIERTEANHLKRFAATLIEQRDQWTARAEGAGNWRHVAHDTAELRDLSKQMAEYFGPVIAKVLEAVAEHEQRAKGMRS